MLEKKEFIEIKKPESDEHDLPLEEIVPDNKNEQEIYEINIINGILNDIKDNEKEKKKEDDPFTVH